MVLKRIFLSFLVGVIVWLSMPLVEGHTATAQVSTCAELTGLATRYHLDTTLDWTRRKVAVRQTITYRNTHTEPLTELVLHSEPHRLSQVNTMTFYNAYDGEGTVLNSVTFDEMRMTVPLTNPVEVGCDAVVELVFDINLQELSNSNPLGWLAYTEKQINLAHWFPVIAPYDFGDTSGWYTAERHFIGEQAVTDLADYEVALHMENAPTNVVLVAPGTVTQVDAANWHIVHNGSRDLGLSFSTIYQLNQQQVGEVSVELYTFATTYRGSVTQALQDTTRALALYTEIYGAYPHDRLVIVEGDFADGLELSGMAFVGTDWFVGWNGNQMHWLTIITVHEVAHQWFYAQVANDQANDPYLDEALSTYSELLFFERYHPELVEEWWQFRIRQYNLGTDTVDSTVYDYTNWRPYINTIYFRGVMMLNEIQLTIGDQLFYRWLADYYEQNGAEIATPVSFWGAMSRFGYDSTADIRAKYLENPNILTN